MKTTMALVESNDLDYLYSVSNLEDSTFRLSSKITWEVKRIVICHVDLNLGIYVLYFWSLKKFKNFYHQKSVLNF